MKSKAIKIIGLFLLQVLLIDNAQAQSSTYFNVSGIAIKGYDPVAYFTEGKAVPGVDSFSILWSGVRWKFVSDENRRLFEEKPGFYAPQYGGYCAFGCSENHLSPTDPKAWTILDNKLYLNYNTDVKARWLRETRERIVLADQFWPLLRK